MSTIKTCLNRLMSDEKQPATYWIGGWWASELFCTCWEKRFIALAMIWTLDCPGNGIVAVSTHKFCECEAYCVLCDDHIVLAVKRHIEETAKKLTSFSFTFFKWLINFSFYFIYLVFQRSTKVDIELVKYNSHSTERVTTIKYTL